MPILVYWLLGTGVAAAGLGYFVKDTAQAADTTSNSLIKVAAAAAIGYVILKKTKVI